MNNMKVKESKKHRDVMQQIKGRYWIEGPTQESRAEIKEVGEKIWLPDSKRQTISQNK